MLNKSFMNNDLNVRVSNKIIIKYLINKFKNINNYYN